MPKQRSNDDDPNAENWASDYDSENPKDEVPF